MSLVRYNSKIIITVALISLLSACTRENSLKDTQNKRSGESQAIVDARQFFSEHPEYISSAELEQKLYREFAQVTTVPAYKEMSMYQLLVISQDRSRQNWIFNLCRTNGFCFCGGLAKNLQSPG